jgi:hypothetical protein
MLTVRLSIIALTGSSAWDPKKSLMYSSVKNVASFRMTSERKSMYLEVSRRS